MTKSKTESEKVALFADAPGLWWGATRFNGGRVDYAALKRLVSGQSRVIHVCHAWLADRPGLDGFQASLRNWGYGTDVVPRGADIDTLIQHAASDAAAWCDTIAIAASAGRYLGLKETLTKRGVKLEIWAFPVACALDDMRAQVDKWCPLGEQATSQLKTA